MEFQQSIFIIKEHEQPEKIAAVGFASTNNIKLAIEYYCLTNVQYCWVGIHAIITNIILTIKFDENWNNFQIAHFR